MADVLAATPQSQTRRHEVANGIDARLPAGQALYVDGYAVDVVALVADDERAGGVGGTRHDLHRHHALLLASRTDGAGSVFRTIRWAFRASGQAEGGLFFLVALNGQHEPALVDEFPHRLGNVPALFLGQLDQEREFPNIMVLTYLLSQAASFTRRYSTRNWSRCSNMPASLEASGMKASIATDARRILELAPRLFLRRGIPSYIRSDNALNASAIRERQRQHSP